MPPLFSEQLHGADATCPFLHQLAQITWLQCLLESVNRLPAQ
jgi:hypothetical protein